MKNSKDRTMGGRQGGRKTSNRYVSPAGGEAAEPGEIAGIIEMAEVMKEVLKA